jgi:hypothetical protein
MAITLSNVNIGTGPSAGDGDPLRSAFTIINNNFQTRSEEHTSELQSPMWTN